MKKIQIDPMKDTLEVRTNSKVLDALLANELDIPMLCGGKGLCSTCHVWIEEGMENLTPVTDRERMTLGLVSGANTKSRLSCQCQVISGDIRVLVPNVQYVEQSTDLLSLVGKRAERHILHPISSKVLIEQGKLITKSRILQLKDVDHDVNELRSAAN